MNFQFHNYIFKYFQKAFLRSIHANIIVYSDKNKYQKKGSNDSLTFISYFQGIISLKKKKSFSKSNFKANVKLNESLPRIFTPLKLKLSLVDQKQSHDIGIESLNFSVIDKMDLCGGLFNFPSNILEKMKNLGVFQFERKIDHSKDPVVVLRESSVYIGRKLLDDNISSKDRRIILIGNQGTGKSFCLLQAQCLAFQKGWVVLAIPRGIDIVNNTTPFFYHEKTGLWRQPEYTSSLLDKFLKANFDILDKIFLSKEYYAGNHIVPKFTPLSRLLEIGILNLLISHDILEIFLKELNIGNCPPVLFTFDNISVICSPSQYISSEYKAIHPCDLALVKTFYTYLNGEFSFDRGAIISCTSKSFNNSDRILEVSLGFLKNRSYENIDERIISAVNGVEYYVIGNYTPIERKNIDNSISKEFIKEIMLLSGCNPRELFWNCLRMI